MTKEMEYLRLRLLLTLSTRRLHHRSPRPLHPLQLTPLLEGGYAFQHLPDPWRLSEVYIQPASKRTFFTKSATVHNTLSKHAKPQPSTPLKSRNALQWTKKKEERVPQSRLLPRSFDDRRSHNCGRLWHGKTDYTTDGETQQHRAIPRNKQIDSPFKYE